MIQKNDDKAYLVYDHDVIIQVYDEGVLVFGMSLDDDPHKDQRCSERPIDKVDDGTRLRKND